MSVKFKRQRQDGSKLFILFFFQVKMAWRKPVWFTTKMRWIVIELVWLSKYVCILIIQRLPLKDFHAEARPIVDIGQVLEKNIFLLDDNEVDQPSSPVDFMESILGKMNLSIPIIKEAIQVLFTHEKSIWIKILNIISMLKMHQFFP